MGLLFYQRKQHTYHILLRCWKILIHILHVICQYHISIFKSNAMQLGTYLKKMQYTSRHALQYILLEPSQQTNSRQCPNVSANPIKVTRISSPICQWGIFYSYHQKKTLLVVKSPITDPITEMEVCNRYLWAVFLWRTQVQVQFSKQQNDAPLVPQSGFVVYMHELAFMQVLFHTSLLI